MTTFQHLDVAASMVVAGEDAMELSTEMDRRYLGDQDIDIDLGPEGRSPDAQEDEYMLEDALFTEDRSVYGSQVEGNDDEMTDEVVVPGIVSAGHGQDNNIHLADQDEFDILVDDEDLNDVDDTMAILSGTAPQSTIHPDSSEPSSENQSHGIFANQFALNMNHEIEPGISYNSEQTGEDPSNPYPLSTSGVIHPLGNDIDPRSFMDGASILEPSFLRRTTDLQPVHNEEVEYTTERVSDNHDTERDRGIHGSGLKQAENEELETELEFDLEGVGNQSSSPAQTRDEEEGAPVYIISEHRLENLTDSGQSVELEPAVQETIHDQDVSGNDVQDRTAYDILNQSKENEVEETSAHHQTGLHPVVVLYQQNEIFLFPPNDNDGQYAQTYFLEDESLANQNVKALLEALRLVLADSINEQDELEISFVSLGLDICETSSASSNTSLSQIIDIYLQLQHNDGVEHPNPLQMTLNMKVSFTNRLEYLYSVIAGGIGFLDISTTVKAKDMDEATEQSEDHSGTSRDVPESSYSGVEKRTNEEEQQNDGQGETEEVSNVQHIMPTEGQESEESIQVVALNTLEPQQHSNTSSDQEYDEGVDVKLSEDHSICHADVVRVSEASPLSDRIAEQSASEKQDEGLHASSTTSSTLDGDGSDTADGVSYSQPFDKGMPHNDHNGIMRKAEKTNDDHWSIVDEIGDENGKESYDGIHRGSYDAGLDADDATTFDANTDHLRTELNRNDCDQGLEGKYEDSVATTTYATNKQESSASSKVDGDEITYDEEDEFEEEADADDAGTRNSALSAKEQDSESGLERSNESVARPDSLKRLRPGEDDELSSMNNSQELKRFRSE